MTNGEEVEYDFHSDEDGELFLHSDDPASTRWTVEVVGRGYGDDTDRRTSERYERRVGFPALNWHVALSAWPVGRDYCHVELVDADGNRRLLDGTCPHAHQSSARPPKCARCGRPSSWVVALMYSRDAPAGRLMPYCDECRADANPGVRGLTIPWAMFKLEPRLLLLLTYQGGATLTEPSIVSEMLGVPPAGWFEQAREIVAKAAG